MWHLIHPACVHFSLASIVAGGALECWGIIRAGESAERRGSWLLLFGLITLVPTIASGYLARNTVEMPLGAVATFGDHERNGWILLAALFATQFWKGWCGGRLPDSVRPLYAMLIVGVVLLAAYSGWLGGRLVYGFGVGVGMP